MARVLFFGKLASLAGRQELQAPLPPGETTVAGLIDLITKDDAELGAALKEASVRVIINEQMDDNAVITDDDEVAFLPPVSGG